MSFVISCWQITEYLVLVIIQLQQLILLNYPYN